MAPPRVAIGQIENAVTEDARRKDADVIVIGRASVAEWRGRWRTHPRSTPSAGGEAWRSGWHGKPARPTQRRASRNDEEMDAGQVAPILIYRAL